MEEMVQQIGSIDKEEYDRRWMAMMAKGDERKGGRGGGDGF